MSRGLPFAQLISLVQFHFGRCPGAMSGFVSLSEDIVFDIACYAGPKATVRFALISKVVSDLAPKDSHGISDKYMKEMECPSSLTAGLIGISKEDTITLFPGADGRMLHGAVTHMTRTGDFAFLSEDGSRSLIAWSDIAEINNEVLPLAMPLFDIEFVFLMLRQYTPDHIVERMLFFSIRHRKVHFLREIIRRLKPLPQVLGGALLMIWFHESLLESVSKDIDHDCEDCCKILMDAGAWIPVESAVRVPNTVLATKYAYYQNWGKIFPALKFRQWRVAVQTLGRPIPIDVFDFWFPLQLAHDGPFYRGPNSEIMQYDANQWIFSELEVVEAVMANGRQFHSIASANVNIPTLGEWSRFPNADYPESYRFMVSIVDISSVLDAFALDKRKLACAAGILGASVPLRTMELWHGGWDVRRDSQLLRTWYVLRFYPEGWEGAVGVFARTCHSVWKRRLDAFLARNGIEISSIETSSEEAPAQMASSTGIPIRL